jgi:hypothetical protein
VTTFAVLATGPSMSQAVADRVKHLGRIAVKDAHRLAPDADALVATDRSWWKRDASVLKFAGRKFGVNPPHGGIEAVRHGVISTSTNSALLGMHVAIHVFGAQRVELYGVDMTGERGAHFFGPHVGRPNTKPERFEVFKLQFARYPVPKGVEVVNRTPGSALLCFPFDLSECCA